jgi:hypothetical protein
MITDMQFPPFQTPYALDIDTNGYLYVVDNECVTILNLDTQKKLFSFALPATTGPRGLKVDSLQRIIYLTLYNQHWIYLFSTKGVLKQKLGTGVKSSKAGEFCYPYGLTLDPIYIYLCDAGNNRVQVLKKLGGSYSHQFGSRGKMNGKFTNPHSIYLSDPAYDLEVKEESRLGEPLPKMVKKEGEEDKGLLYVGDWISVQIFTRRGIFLQRLEGRAEDFTSFHGVYGLSLCDGYLFVTDHGNRRVQVFKRAHEPKTRKTCLIS